MTTPGHGTPPAVTVLVMAYNEVLSLEPTVRELLAVLDRVAPASELIIIDDGSTDGTSDVARSLAAKEARVRVVPHTENRGLGGVYRSGFREARGEFVTFFPADGQFPAEIIADFLPRMTDADFVLGFLPERESTFVSKLLSTAERVLYGVLFGRLPRFQGILMFRRALLDRFALKSTGRGWAVLMEFIIRCSRDECRMISVPTAMRSRMHGRSKVNNLRTIWSNTRQMLALRRLLHAP